MSKIIGYPNRSGKAELAIPNVQVFVRPFGFYWRTRHHRFRLGRYYRGQPRHERIA